MVVQMDGASSLALRGLHDAQRVIGRFTASLQEQVEPDEVVDGSMEVVEDTMQPEAVGSG